MNETKVFKTLEVFETPKEFNIASNSKNYIEA
jgi:hypothetical protein